MDHSLPMRLSGCQYIACPFGLHEKVLVVDCTLEMVYLLPFLNCPSDDGSVAGNLEWEV